MFASFLYSLVKHFLVAWKLVQRLKSLRLVCVQGSVCPVSEVYVVFSHRGFFLLLQSLWQNERANQQGLLIPVCSFCFVEGTLSVSMRKLHMCIICHKFIFIMDFIAVVFSVILYGILDILIVISSPLLFYLSVSL